MSDEFDRRLSSLEGAVKEMRGQLTGIETRSAVDEVHRANIDKRLTGIEDSQKWLLRAFIGGFVAAALTFVVSGGLSI